MYHSQGRGSGNEEAMLRIDIQTFRQLLAAENYLCVHVKGFASRVEWNEDYKKEFVEYLKDLATRYDGGPRLRLMLVWDGDKLPKNTPEMAHAYNTFTGILKDLQSTDLGEYVSVSFALTRARSQPYFFTENFLAKGPIEAHEESLIREQVSHEEMELLKHTRERLMCKGCMLYYITDIKGHVDAIFTEVERECTLAFDTAQMLHAQAQGDMMKSECINWWGAVTEYMGLKGGRLPRFAFLGEAILRITGSNHIFYLGGGPIAKVEHFYSLWRHPERVHYKLPNVTQT